MERIIEVHNGSIPQKQGHLRFVCISDTHNHSIELPQGDVLLHAGDFTRKGSREEVYDFALYLRRQPFIHKIVIAGNHDSPFDIEEYPQILRKKKSPHPCDPVLTRRLLRDFIYLEDSFATVGGYKIYGTPWTEQHYKGAFTVKDKLKIAEKWSMIPNDCDILVTHSPPFRVLDLSRDNKSVGSASLADRVAEIRPKVHLFGHIHEGYGTRTLNGITYINASICNNGYKAVHAPFVFDLPLL